MQATGLPACTRARRSKLLEHVNQRTLELLAQQKKYVEVRKVTSDLALTTAARQVGSSTEDQLEVISEVDSGEPARRNNDRDLHRYYRVSAGGVHATHGPIAG